MRVILIVPLLAGLGCAAATRTVWYDDLGEASREAIRRHKPLLVLSLLGDLKKRC